MGSLILTVKSLREEGILDENGVLNIPMGTKRARFMALLQGVLSLVLPNGIISIGKFAFSDCSSLQKIVLPATLAAIGDYAFDGCGNLQEIVLPDTLAAIGERAFNGCGSLLDIVLPATLTTIGHSAFQGCNSLQNIEFSHLLTVINDYAFTGCSSLKKIAFSPMLTTIGACAFAGCSSLQEIVFLTTLTAIGDGAFEGCSSLREIALPDTLNAIGDYAFKGCSSLGVITLPATLTTVGHSAFYKCDNLVIMYVITSPIPTDISIFWGTAISIHFPNIKRVWVSPKSKIIEILNGPFEKYTELNQLPHTMLAAPARIQSSAGLDLWRWWSLPDIAGNLNFKRLSLQYREMVWTVLLVCERYAGENGSVVIYGEVPVEMWMLIFGFCRRDVSMQYHM
jgi:hypothetical protein